MIRLLTYFDSEKVIKLFININIPIKINIKEFFKPKKAKKVENKEPSSSTY